MREETKQAIAAAWSSRARQARTRFWQSPTVVRHINKTLCGEAIDGANEGGLRLLPQFYREATGQPLPVFERGLSIGAGNGGLEMDLITRGFVRSFDLFEFSPTRKEAGEAAARARGLEGCVRFSDADFFAPDYPHAPVYDLVFWHGALHHMMDAFQAVLTSRAVLREGGLFYANDFVGASRFQWSDEEVNIVNQLRAQLYQTSPALFHSAESDEEMPVYIARPPVELMLQLDPSEAADASNILPAVRHAFPDARIIHTGGLLYHLCLNDILAHIPEESPLLHRILELDDQCRERGLLHYAVIMAVKQG